MPCLMYLRNRRAVSADSDARAVLILRSGLSCRHWSLPSRRVMRTSGSGRCSMGPRGPMTPKRKRSGGRGRAAPPAQPGPAAAAVGTPSTAVRLGPNIIGPLR
jgi:hypothetical protein